MVLWCRVFCQNQMCASQQQHCAKADEYKDAVKQMEHAEVAREYMHSQLSIASCQPAAAALRACSL